MKEYVSGESPPETNIGVRQGPMGTTGPIAT